MASTQKKIVLCQADCGQYAVWYCVQDNADLCERHKREMHTMKIHQAHKIVPIDQKLKYVEPDKCSAHHMPLSLYCEECENSCCLACVTIGSHKQHSDNVKSAADVADKRRNQINEIIEHNEEIASYLQGKCQELERSMQRLNESAIEVKKMIKDRFDCIRVCIDQKQNELEQKLESKYQDCQNGVSSRKKDFNEVIERVQTFLKEARETNELDDFSVIAKTKSIKIGSVNNESERDQCFGKRALADFVIFQCDFDATFKSIKTTLNQLDVMTRFIPNVPVDARWEQTGITVAGGNGAGGMNNQLHNLHGLFVHYDDYMTVLIADCSNHRIMKWKNGDASGQVVAGGNGPGNRLDQLNGPVDVFIDELTDSMIIADRENLRVVRWSNRSGTIEGEILIDNIYCEGLTMDEQRNLYVSDGRKDEVRRYEIDRGDKVGTLVAGGNGKGNGLNQFNYPRKIFLDINQSLYVSDWSNHRVLKWDRGATHGITVAKSSNPFGIYVDTLGILYVAEWGSRRVTRWLPGSEEGTVVVGGNRQGAEANQFNGQVGCVFDKHGNLYFGDYNNHRVQRFNLMK